jgi:rhodanese-related sulfurtransferase
MKKTITTTELTGMLQAGNPVTLLDVRRKEDYEKSPSGIADAPWRDPSAVAEWMQALPKQGEVVIYCVRGGSVSQSVQQQLTEAGVTAKYLEGGLEAYLQQP